MSWTLNSLCNIGISMCKIATFLHLLKFYCPDEYSPNEISSTHGVRKLNLESHGCSRDYLETDSAVLTKHNGVTDTQTDWQTPCCNVYCAMNKVADLHEFEESKRRSTVGGKKCSNNWIDLYNNILSIIKHGRHGALHILPLALLKHRTCLVLVSNVV